MPNDKINNFVDLFERLCRSRFQFLSSEFDYKLQSVRTDTTACVVTFSNGFVSITVEYCPLDGCILIALHRLIDGQMPKPVIFLNPKDELYSFRLDMLILLRTGRTIPQKTEDLFNPQRIDEILSEYAELMKQFAGPVLRGDFAVLPEIKALIAQRTREIQYEGFGPTTGHLAQ